MARPATLLILDGWGIGQTLPTNAYRVANTPNLDRLFKRYPHAQIESSGLSVGLPHGQMGNSEVGHLNLGAGRIVDQDITRIDKIVDSGLLSEQKALSDLVASALDHGTRLHLVGLVSDGGVHSSLDHLKALILEITAKGVPVRLHALLDGRDTPPQSGAGYISELLSWARSHGLSDSVFAIASVGGRYWGMDRDNRWERVEKHWQCIVNGSGPQSGCPIKVINDSYASNKGDEFVEPTIIVSPDGSPIGQFEDKDSVFMFNFRADRVRELVQAFGNSDFSCFIRNRVPEIQLATMTEYRSDFKFPNAFPPHKLEGIFSDILAEHKLSNLRVAETEKYAHVTFFFNGGIDTPWPLEKRVLIDSPKVATYDLQPEMSLPKVTSSLTEQIADGGFDFHVANFANCDMVGHTGNLKAAVAAVEAVDSAVGSVTEAVLDKGGFLIVTADHGNIEQMWDEAGECPYTAHTTNPVPVILVDPEYKGGLSNGRLADITPTLLSHAGIPLSPEMTGTNILQKK
ncbi:MAG: 2,3-bisphosphoglycerate-independent phosphoglycerate mutase [bacterium]|nr:2,3-bisphosphoglycerate-independent phosphoglycerate mutase [bacterium]